MAIKFGDILENQNADNPIVDVSGDNVAGVHFVTEFTSPNLANIPTASRRVGSLVVDTTNNVIYVFNGTIGNFATSTDSGWSKYRDEELAATSIPVSIGDGLTFGKYLDGESIPATGLSALSILLDALTSLQEPVATFDAGTLSIDYSQTVQSNLVKTSEFSVKNLNQAVISGDNYALVSVTLERQVVGSGYSAVASTDSTISSTAFTTGTISNAVGSPANQDFTFADSITTTGGQDTDFRYKISVVMNNGSGTPSTYDSFVGTAGTLGYITVAEHVAPTGIATITLQDTGSDCTNESATLREAGNFGSKIDIAIIHPNPSVDVTSVVLEREINNDGTWVEIHEFSTAMSLTGQCYDSVQATTSVVTGTGTTVGSYTASTVAISGSNITDVKYRVVVTDGVGFDNGTEASVTHRFPALIGYHTEDGSAFTSSNDGDMGTVLTAIRLDDTVQAQYELLGSTTGDPDFGTAVTLNTTGDQHVWIGFPATYNELDTVMVANTSNSLGSFIASGATVPYKSITVSFTTFYGVTNSAYEVYCSNSAGAFTGSAYLIN